MDEGHKFVFFVFVFVFVFLHLISKDSFIVPEVRIVFYKMHSDFEILQIQISISLIRHHGIFNFWRTTGKPSSIYVNICTMYLFRHRIFWWKRVIIYRSWAFFFWSLKTYEGIEYLSQELLCSQSLRLREVHRG